MFDFFHNISLSQTVLPTCLKSATIVPVAGYPKVESGRPK